MDECVIFYSWQSENKKSRNYVDKAIKESIEYINANSKNVTVKLDRDTKGEAGSPNIPITIERKIDDSDVFIADFSVTHDALGKKQLSQNVMYEAGYAIARLGDENCIFLHNEDDCKAKELPFDIAQRRLLNYSMDAKNLKDRLLDVLPLYVSNAQIKRKLRKQEGINEWEEIILKMFGTIKDEKILITTKVGKMRIGGYSQLDKKLVNKIQCHNDPQEIRAAFASLVEKHYLECTPLSNGNPCYRLLQNGYQYIRSHFRDKEFSSK